MEILLNDSLLYGKLSEEGGLILRLWNPAGFLQELHEAVDGKFYHQYLTLPSEMNAAVLAFCGKMGVGMGERAQSHDVSRE